MSSKTFTIWESATGRIQYQETLMDSVDPLLPLPPAGYQYAEGAYDGNTQYFDPAHESTVLDRPVNGASAAQTDTEEITVSGLTAGWMVHLAGDGVSEDELATGGSMVFTGVPIGDYQIFIEAFPVQSAMLEVEVV